jgi:thioredoxin
LASIPSWGCQETDPGAESPRAKRKIATVERVAIHAGFGSNGAHQHLERLRMSDKIVHITDESFEDDVLKAEHPVLVDYWAEWCGPCKVIAPILGEIAEEYAGKLQVAKLNIDENPATPPKYGIRGIPTLMLFKGGNVEATKVGALSKSQLSAFLDSNL